MSAGYVHVILIGQHVITDEVRHLYSRFDREAPEAHLQTDHLWQKFAQQVTNTLGHGFQLLAWIADEAHAHPLVVTAAGAQDRTDKAHAL